ncbi:hypothetical protein [uncultured Maritimibacter sp.]|jgi:flagellar motility protein MotE (MotC chaperone)|uniref:MotE family protein n=1 Tax=uncultured Maritimibacter sp. TaxID=991866 RepID=UPI000AB4CF04|nr:hypothetical protein [uncultured Maritimibacter sp.]
MSAPKTPREGKGHDRRARRRGIVGRSALTLIAMCFMGSFVVRVAAETGMALAAETGDEPAATQTPVTDIARLVQSLKEREDLIAEREAALEERAQTLAIAEDQIRKNLEALEQAEADLKSMIALSAEAAENDIEKLTSLYENMKPKEAVAVFAAMEPNFAAGFLGRMRSDAAAAILAGLDPEQAYAISVILAGRNANAPTQ